MLARLMIILLLAVTSSGCAVSKNPREGGLLGGLLGINSGEYDSQIQLRQEKLNHQQERNDDLQTQSMKLRDEAQARTRELSSEQQKLAQMEEELKELETGVEQLQLKSGVQQTEVAHLGRKIAEQKKQMKTQQDALLELNKAGGSTANPERYRVLVKERNRLAEEYKRLMRYYKALSNAAS